MADLPIGDVIEETWERFVASPGDFLLLAFLATATPLVVNALALYPLDPDLIGTYQGAGGTGAAFGAAGALIQSSIGSFTGSGALSGVPPLQILAGAVVATVGGVVLGALFGGALVAEALDDPEEAGAGRSLRASVDHLAPLVVGGIVIAVLALALLLPGAGLMFLGLPTGSLTYVGVGIAAIAVGIVVLLYLLVALYIWRVVIVDEDAGAIEALKRSWGLTRGNRLAVFLVILVIGIVTGIVASVVQLPFLYASGGGFSRQPRQSFSVLQAVGTVAAGTITGAFLPIASVRIFAHLTGRPEPDDETEPGPSPPEGYVPVEPGS